MKDMSENNEDQNVDDPRDAAIGNTEPAEESKAVPKKSDQPGDRAEAPDGVESEEYPGPSEETSEE